MNERRCKVHSSKETRFVSSSILRAASRDQTAADKRSRDFEIMSKSRLMTNITAMVAMREQETKTYFFGLVS